MKESSSRPPRAPILALTQELALALVGVLFLCLTLVSCDPARHIKSIVRSDLFSIGYGLSENQIDISSGGEGGIDMTMREGIFHILDGTGKKVLKLSSYGDLLALLYDPERSPEPRVVKNVVPKDKESGGEAQNAPGRYAAPIHFIAPGKIAVGTDQTIYIVDRVSDPSARIYDSQAESYCDRIVRRFGSQGAELTYLGQEGPGGSPFPHIVAVDAFENDTIAVVSATETMVLIHHFKKNGDLLSSLRLSRSSLPMPASLAASAEKNSGVRIHASLDGILETVSKDSFDIILKIDYYKEYFDPESMAISRNEFAGSWIFVLNGLTGKASYSLSIVPENPDAPIPELIGMSSGLYYLLSDTPTDESARTTQGVNDGASRMLQLVDAQGKVHQRFRLDLPEGAEEVMVLKVSAAGQIYALLKTREAVDVVWWDYR
ncbi:MAG TPA: hypothetical protein VN445_03575 [Rectinemataceae bacterium]|nr:hypothetical protein [Rectinemataceae bacterium]